MLCYGGYFHGDIWADNGYFKGKIEADEGYFKGTLTATTGTIGGLNIYEDGFGIKGGNFYVDSSGNLTANNANISGDINVTTGGSIGNFSVYDNYLEFRTPDSTSGRDLVVRIGQLDNSSNYGIIAGKTNTNSSTFLSTNLSKLVVQKGNFQYDSLETSYIRALHTNSTQISTEDIYFNKMRVNTALSSQSIKLTSSNKNITLNSTYSFYRLSTTDGDTLDGCTISGTGDYGQIVFLYNENSSHRIGIAEGVLISGHRLYIVQQTGVMLMYINGTWHLMQNKENWE